MLPAPATARSPVFADNHYYGHDRALHRYAGLERPLPIPGRLLHGWTPEAGFAPAQLATRFPFLVWNRSNLDGCRERGARSVEAIGSPFLYHLHGRTLPPPTSDRRLLYVPFHSAEQARVQGATPMRERLDFLRAQGFSRITICAYWHDFAQPEVRAAIEAEGCPVVSNGHRDTTPDFLDRIVANLTDHDLVATDRLSTLSIYALAAGRPAFVFGKTPGISPGPDPDGSRWAALQRDRFPELLWDNFDGTCHRDTAHRELGAEFLLSPEAMRDRFDWNTVSLPRLGARCAVIKATKFATGRYHDLRHRLTGEPIPAWL
jgi:hypothetical protein